MRERLEGIPLRSPSGQGQIRNIGLVSPPFASPHQLIVCCKSQWFPVVVWIRSPPPPPLLLRGSSSSIRDEREAKKEAFRKYLESSGVLDALTKVLVALYEENDRPSSAVEFVQQKLGGPSISEYEKLLAEKSDLQLKYDELLAAHREKCRELEELRNLKLTTTLKENTNGDKLKDGLCTATNVINAATEQIKACKALTRCCKPCSFPWILEVVLPKVKSSGNVPEQREAKAQDETDKVKKHQAQDDQRTEPKQTVIS
ncbi:C-Myc-binding protein [Musa troglodytarum]|uniref:c-Myc-binding protein n=2 Tax=Musa troglodytarum TaxID=320322 RepID=A0A9E7JSA4_9LILI|nr:C-Myc-binding protein [Musa troglodytarum]URD90764.1 C-Myc-binding protein [Musa troglodytarum]